MINSNKPCLFNKHWSHELIILYIIKKDDQSHLKLDVVANSERLILIRVKDDVPTFFKLG